jgi:hypothetical protein
MGPAGMRGERTSMGAVGIDPPLEAGVTTAGSPDREAATSGGETGGIATVSVKGAGPEAGESKGGSPGNDAAVARNGSDRLPVSTDQGDQ